MLTTKDFYIGIERSFQDAKNSVLLNNEPIYSSRPSMEFTTEQRAVLTLRQSYNALRKLEEKDVITLLKHFTKAEEVIDYIVKHGFLDLRKLASLVVWLTNTLELKVSDISFAQDLETGELLFVEIYIEDCGWDEWKLLSRIVKKQLVSEGFDDVAGRVALVCWEGLKTQRS